jgi:hypothetical protein
LKSFKSLHRETMLSAITTISAVTASAAIASATTVT